ncbi:maleylpyruvate isomerase N-terminal domain-containing protein [Actinoplanes sp. NPDC051851]|uniref:maleylpyruvate isomerase N-terminal domain-containing protein n=1 Tax=Actinoplanes sp. NPDC051851 TaxID=3154753 RepID=UPI003416F15B
MTGDDVERALGELLAALTPLTEDDWQAAAGDLEWTCRATVAHIAHDLFAYAAQLATGAKDAYLPHDLVARPVASNAELLQVVTAAGRILATVVRSRGPEARAWHWGPTGPDGFAALGVNEILLHTWDVTRGLGAPEWRPPADLCAAVLARLFPNAPGADPVDGLLWCTGRIALPDRPRLTSWKLHASLD